MQIRVKQTHIERGQRLSSANCPVALAMNDQTGLKAVVGFSIYGLYRTRKDDGLVDHDDLVAQGDLPSGVINRIGVFDRTGKMEPFEFEICYDKEYHDDGVN